MFETKDGESGQVSLEACSEVGQNPTEVTLVSKPKHANKKPLSEQKNHTNLRKPKT